MSKQQQQMLTLLRWSALVSSSDVQDPLGLALRGGARLASRLLYCITSITPRARYFSFIPWCIADHRRAPGNSGLRNAIVLREHALTLGCVSYHEGSPCVGGNLVGSREASKWLAKGRARIDLRKTRFAQNPALAAYQNSIINLRLIEAPEQPDSDALVNDQPESIAFDDLELSALGKELAAAYDSKVARLRVRQQLKDGKCEVSDLKTLGRNGGLCEITQEDAPDRALLRDIFFFARKEIAGGTNERQSSHAMRRNTLFLIMELVRQLSERGVDLNEDTFAEATYFRAVTQENAEPLVIQPPPQLDDISNRWRMFHFHHYMAVALEGMFSWLLASLDEHGLAGAPLEVLVSSLNDKAAGKHLEELFEVKIPRSFASLSARELFARIGGDIAKLDQAGARHVDRLISVDHALAEPELEWQVRYGEHRHSSTGLAIATLLLVVTMSRFSRWATSDYGLWLGQAADDPYIDIVPSMLEVELRRKLGDWWNRPLSDLVHFVLARFIVSQHIQMSYTKSQRADRCLLEQEQGQLRATGLYDKLGMRNTRLGSAVQILKDLALLTVEDEEVLTLTREGKRYLASQLKALTT